MKKHIYLTLFLVFCLSGCTEQYIMQSNTYENVLVVEATITNELKNQEVMITRSYKLEASSPVFEKSAEVFITDDSGNRYDFTETVDRYISETPFQAEPGKRYQLHINTSEGKSYTSSAEILAPINEITNVVPTVEAKDNVRGVAIHVNSYDPQNTSKYYRYEYEESYKLIAPYWSPSKAVVSGGPGNYVIDVVPREQETRICYTTKKNTDILQYTTSGFQEDRVDFPIRFISNRDYIIANRYSILVKQYVQNLSAYTYYKTLKKISGSGSFLSQNQPGFFYGNLKSVDDPQEKIIGFFDVSTVSSKRIFFNYTDLFPGESLPPYFTKCSIKRYGFCFDYALPECDGYNLISAIQTNTLVYYSGISSTFDLVAPECGDCTTFSSNIKPSFWID